MEDQKLRLVEFASLFPAQWLLSTQLDNHWDDYLQILPPLTPSNIPKQECS